MGYPRGVPLKVRIRPDTVTLETIIAICVCPVVVALTGAVVYLWKEQVKAHKELAEQRELEIARLKKEHDHLEENIHDLKDRIHAVEMENARLEAKFIVLQGSNQSSPLPMWMKDKYGKVLVCNHAYERIFLQPLGKRLEDYINHTDKDVWPEHIAQAFARNDRQVMQTRAVLDTTEQIRSGNGSDYPVRIIKFPRISGGVVIGVDGIAIPDDLRQI